MDGSEGSSSQSVKDKIKLISEKIKIPLILWDERLSTVGAFNISSQLDVNVTKRVKNIDENAAAFILQGVLDLPHLGEPVSPVFSDLLIRTVLSVFAALPGSWQVQPLVG